MEDGMQKKYKALLEAAEAISAQAGQMDAHCRPPVLIEHDQILALRDAIHEILNPTARSH